MAPRYISALLPVRNLVLFKQCSYCIKINQTNQTTMSTSHFATVSFVTAPNQDVARQLSRKLVENRLAACVNIVNGVESFYEWQNKIENDTEVLMIIKSHSEKSEDLAQFVQSNHPYDCPEVVTLKVESGSEPYLKWIRESISKKPVL